MCKYPVIEQKKAWTRTLIVIFGIVLLHKKPCLKFTFCQSLIINQLIF